MFKKRTSAPNEWNALYNNRSNGGLSWCINGYPTNAVSNVLANCVGYACARFNEIYNELAANKGIKYPQLCCNAEEFWTVADQIGLKKGSEPKPGAIMCWEGVGSLAGHVAVVEEVLSSSSVYTSESGYGGPLFWNANRSKGGGNWGANSNYIFKGFIYNPAVKDYKWSQKWHLYADNKMVIGWARVNGKWYYLDQNGIMLTGWQKINDKWYYLAELGAMCTGWLKDNGKWYYLNNSGAMVTGWQKINWHGEKWFYFKPSGEMVTGDYKIDGKVYHFDNNGVWQG